MTIIKLLTYLIDLIDEFRVAVISELGEGILGILTEILFTKFTFVTIFAV